MSQKRYKSEEIIHKLRVAEVELSKGNDTGQICRKLGITEQTYYRWRKVSIKLYNWIKKGESTCHKSDTNLKK